MSTKQIKLKNTLRTIFKALCKKMRIQVHGFSFIEKGLQIPSHPSKKSLSHKD